jgi:hypothetical protein
MESAFLLFLFRACQLSWDVSVNAGFLHSKAVTFKLEINEGPCIYIQD